MSTRYFVGRKRFAWLLPHQVLFGGRLPEVNELPVNGRFIGLL